MGWLTDPFAFAFFGRALLAGVLAGAVLGALGAFVVVRRMAYIAHGLSHAVVGGAAISGAIAANPLLGAGVWAFLTALLIERVSRLRGLYADTAIGVVTTASFAIGIAVLSAASRWERNLESFLFGSLLGVRTGDLLLLVGVVTLVAVVLLTRYQPLLFVTFDREVARIHGLRVDRYEVLFALLLTAAVVASMRVLGVLLVAAAVVMPAAAARLLTERFEMLLPLAVLLGAGAAVPGMYLSWYLDVAAGPAVVLIQTGLLALAALWSGVRGRREIVAGMARPA